MMQGLSSAATSTNWGAQLISCSSQKSQRKYGTVMRPAQNSLKKRKLRWKKKQREEAAKQKRKEKALQKRMDKANKNANKKTKNN